MGMEDNADCISGAPIVANLQLFEYRKHRLADHIRVAIVWAFFGDIAEHVSAVSAENGSDTDVALPILEATTGEFCKAHTDDKLIADRLVVVDCPRRAVEFRI